MKSALNLIKEMAERGALNQAKREIASHPDQYDLTELVIPFGEKPLFQACAEVLCALDNATLSRLATELFRWFRNMNWPGSELILERVKQLPPGVVRDTLARAKQKAADVGDEEWLYNIAESFSEYE